MPNQAERRSLDQVSGLPRSAAGSLWRTVRPGGAPLRFGWQFLGTHVWPWAVNYVKYVLRPRRKLPTYLQSVSERPGVFSLPDPCRIALAGDWGTGTESAANVAKQIQGHDPAVTIHLGDVYYSGTAQEYKDYFLGLRGWPRGSKGTYALNGNHEMYSGGEGYFGVALPALGQRTSYFALESEQWRIVAIDTGYFARTFPLLELALKSWIRLPKPNRTWLRDVVFADPEDRRPVLLLSHHQWFSAFDSEYPRVGANVAPYLDRVLLWFWGHEHRFAAYAPFGLEGARQVRARCIGHGGMPVEIGATMRRSDRNLACWDTRYAGSLDGVPIGYCGYALLDLSGPTLTVAHNDETGATLLTERWTQRSGGCYGEVIAFSPRLAVPPGKAIGMLVQS